MKKLIAKIREILRNRRVRKMWTRTVSSIACLVVFVTTYALVLPAITMESQALCGIEAHQHDDSCYEERLTCTIPESDGHTHTEDCYSTKQKLICDRSEHVHNSDCYDENGNLICSLEEHQHGRECFEDTRELVCGLEEAEGHHHDSSCYEKVLTCGKEAHTHSQACYREDAASAMATEHAAVAATTVASEGGNVAADANGADGSSDAFGTLDPAQTDSEGFVPASDEANLQEPLNGNTAISNNNPAVDETRGSGNSDEGIISDDSSSAEENITEAVEETHPAVSFEDTLTVYTGSLGSDITGSLSSDTNAGNTVSPDTDTAAGTLPASSNMTVSVSAEAGTFPAGTTMVLSAVTDMDAVAEAVEGTVDSKTRGFQAVDISFRDKDGNEVEPLKPISVTMRSDSIKAATEDSSMAPVVVHVEDQNDETAESKDTPAATVIETLPNTTENINYFDAPAATYSPEEISFEADAFSIYAIVYTVDFEYAVDGKVYQFSLPGGGFVSFTDLVEVLGIVDDTNSEKNEDELESETAENAAEKSNNEAAEASGENSDSNTNTNSDTNTALTLGDVEVSEATRNFVADVEKVEFSSPELLDISKIGADITVGQIKESHELEVEYSAELTEEQIAEINGQTVETGDWALISMQPFDTEETLTVTMKNGEVFTIRVTDAAIQYPGTTVHYGYVDENGIFVEFPDSMKPSNNITGLDTSFGWHYLIYDFYEEEPDGTSFQWNYSGTYYSANGTTPTPVSSGTSIQPALRYYNKRWRYFDKMSYTNSAITNNSNWKEVSNSSDIYVVYEKPTITNGGSPTLKINAELPDEPDILKQSVENNDGTNTLSLSITGSTAPMEVEKLADVIVILDLSSSMRRSIGSEYEYSNYTTNADSRYYQAKLAIQNLANRLYQRNADAHADLYRMGLITFSNDSRIRQTLTENKTTFQAALNGITEYESNGTNWEYALQLANEMSVDSGRATYVVFVTDGNPTLRQTRWELKDNQLTGNANVEEGDLYYGGLAGGKFGGDNSRLKFRDYFGSATFGGLWTPHFDSWDWRNQHGCYNEIQSMVDHNKNFYAVGISDAVSVSSLDNLVSQAGLSSDHSTVETTGEGLAKAFETILAAMDGHTGQADIKMFDGITDLTQTISKVNQKEGRLIGADGNFTYWKSTKPDGWDNWTKDEKSAYTEGMNYAGSDDKPDGYNSWSKEKKAAFVLGQSVTFTEWTTRETDGCDPAVYNTETGAVEWNMGNQFMLEDGVTYKVSFICWPSQDAYDIIAKLNNGTITFGDTGLYDQDVWDQFEGDAASGYTLKTNAEGANTKYSTATNVNGKVTVGDERDPLPFQHVPPMPLDKDKLNVAKTWQASKIDSQKPESVILQVVGDNEIYKQFKIEPTKMTDGSTTPNLGRSENIFISCGHLKVNKDTGEVVVYESGHDFTLREVEENSRHWDLDASICRPMKINMEETMLVLVEEGDVPAAMKSNTNLAYLTQNGNEYYRVDNKVYKVDETLAEITGSNTRRSFLDLAKEVLVDDKVWTEPVDTKFTYKIKIDIDPTTLSWDPDLEKYIIISIRGDGYSPAGAIADTTYPTTAKLPSESGMPSSLIHEHYDDLYLVAESGKEFFLSIKSGWSVRFLNLPSGTTYSIEEVLPEDSDYDFNNARLEIRKDSSSETPLSTKEYSTVKVEESITETSTLYKVVYQNDAKGKEVQILKTEQDASTPLGDAIFDLYTESAYISDPQGAPFKPDLVSSNQADTKGRLDLGKLPVGKYYLVETKAPDGYTMRTDPVVITVNKSSVTYSDGTTLSLSGNGISQIGDVFQLKVTNDAGVELPSTGGPGTRLLTILGSFLILGAGTLLWRRRRFI